MWEASSYQVSGWIAVHAQAASYLTLALVSLTSAALGLLTRSARESVALWMMGAASNETWATSFTKLFDAIFGRRHLGLRCLAVSACISVVTVVVLWVGLGTFGGLSERLTIIEAFWQVLALAFLINAFADYVSLLETRLLLGWLARPFPVWFQAFILLVDLVITAAIIWVALWAAQRFGLTGFVLGDERDDLAEIVGLFSPLALFFYSTFVTSIWTWGFILSGWLMRLLARMKFLHPVYAEHPGKALFTAFGVSACVVCFVGSAVFGLLTKPDAQNLTVVDRALCSLAQGEVCLHVRSLTEDEATRLALTLDACRGGITKECTDRGLDQYEIDDATAERYWRVACDAGDARGCNSLGYLYKHRFGRDSAEVARLFRQACDGGNLNGCTSLAFQHLQGKGVEKDPAEVARLYRQACDGGNPNGCAGLGWVHEKGFGMEKDPAEAARLYRQACDGGYARGCTSLGWLHQSGIGMDPDPAEAARLYRQACDGGDAHGCTNLGWLHQSGIGMDPDPAEAARLYRQGCDGGNARGCTNLGWFHEKGFGMEKDPAEAARLYRQGCDGGNARGCTNLGWFHEKGFGMEKDPAEAARLYRQACDGGDAPGCDYLKELER